MEDKNLQQLSDNVVLLIRDSGSEPLESSVQYPEIQEILNTIALSVVKPSTRRSEAQNQIFIEE
jgi:hypothetical protein